MRWAAHSDKIFFCNKRLLIMNIIFWKNDKAFGSNMGFLNI